MGGNDDSAGYGRRTHKHSGHKDEGTPWRLKENERIGFCFPVHGWRPPVVMREFIKKLDISEPSGHYVFALCTAGDNIGEAIDILRDDLSSIGIHLDSAFSLIMPESYVGLPFMDVDTPVKEKKKKEKAAEDIKIAIKSITNDEKGVNELDNRQMAAHQQPFDRRFLYQGI